MGATGGGVCCWEGRGGGQGVIGTRLRHGMGGNERERESDG